VYLLCIRRILSRRMASGAPQELGGAPRPESGG